MTHHRNSNRIATLAISLALALTAAAMSACNSNRAPRASSKIPTQEERAAVIRDSHSIAMQAQRAEQRGDIARAIDLYRRAVDTNPNFSQAWNNLGRLLLDVERPIDAAIAFRAAADADPSGPEPYFNLGVLWERQGYLDDAVRFYNESLQRNARYLPALRRILILDMRFDLDDARTPDRLRMAMLLDNNPEYRALYERHQQTLRTRRNAPMLGQGS